jgi:hypothetical protein
MDPKSIEKIREALELSKTAMEAHEADSMAYDPDYDDYIEVKAFKALKTALEILDNIS